MEYETMGKLIQALRKEKGLTQKQLADMLNITDKAVSKWERDVACPDTTTLPKLAEILGVSVESLLNAKAEANSPEEPAVEAAEIESDVNPDREHHKAQLKHLLMKGIPGFAVGFILMIVAFISISGVKLSTFPIMLIAALLAGAWFACFPYGYSLLNQYLGRWNIGGNVLVVAFLFLLKCLLALWVGTLAYPIVIVYNIIKAQKTKQRVKRALIIVIILFVCYVIFAAGALVIEYINNSNNLDDSNQDLIVTDLQKPIDFLTLKDHLGEISLLYQEALDVTQAQEREDVGLGWEIGEQSRICGAFYMTAKNPENPVYNSLEKIEVENAVVVVTGYYVRSGGIPIEAWELNVHIYPNICLDQSNMLHYAKESVYYHSLRVEDLGEIKEWIQSVYSEMDFFELAIP